MWITWSILEIRGVIVDYPRVLGCNVEVRECVRMGGMCFIT